MKALAMKTAINRAYSYWRFSSPEQGKGDSFRRQLELSEKYAETHGLYLDESLRLTDRGLSAFHGIHRIKGALGEFHRLVEAGEIVPGSVLLVESLDRLSREQVLDALTSFTNLIRAGIKVVTLADGMEYDRKSINSNFGQLLMSLVIMSRAHDESAMKSLRGQASWDHKRKDATNGHKMTKKSPEWVALSEDRKSFIVRSEVAQVIKWIFQMKLEGKGSWGIARTLNQKEGIWIPPPRGKGKKFSGGWRTSYINRLLKNKALLGEYQPHKMIVGKRVPVGDPIPDYFPAIIDKELFDRVQAAIQHNREKNGRAGGRNGAINNLFSHIARCYYCGAPMTFFNKGESRTYLVCDKARRGLGCKKIVLRYDRIEPLLLGYCKGLNANEILPGNGDIKTELSTLRNQLQAVEGELMQVKGNINHLLDNLEIGEMVKDRLKARQEQKLQLEAQRDTLSSQIAQLSSTAQDAEEQLMSVHELIEKMSELEGEERINVRLNLRNQLRRLIDQINFHPDKNQLGMIFRTGERRLLILEESEVMVLDVEDDALKAFLQLRSKPWDILEKDIKPSISSASWARPG